MKLTKTKLKTLIKEELQNVLQEATFPTDGMWTTRKWKYWRWLNQRLDEMENNIAKLIATASSQIAPGVTPYAGPPPASTPPTSRLPK